MKLLRGLGAFLVGLLLAACGGSFVAPAAVVNGVPISQSTVQERLEAALADPSLASQLAGPDAVDRRADLARQVLAVLIRQQVIERYADAHDITLTDAEVQESLTEAVDQIGGQAQFDRELKIRNLSLDDVRENIRQVLLAQKVQAAVVKASGAPAEVDPQQADQIFSLWLTTELRRSDIEVNPSFGAFDPKRVTVCRISSTAGDLTCPQA